MRVLTLHQPWASLIALGVKTIETRSWSAPSSLVGERIAIHAAVTPKAWNDLDAPNLMSERGPIQTILGALGVLEDDGHRWPSPWIIEDSIHVGDVVLPLWLCLPMVDRLDTSVADYSQPVLIVRGNRLHTSERGSEWDWSDQFPYGDFRPGRWAWLLEDVQPLVEPVSFKGGQRLTKSWVPA